jgi:hypothetical protein
MHRLKHLFRIPMTPTVIIPLSLPEVNKIMLIEVAARSKAWVYGRLLAGIADSNPAGDMDVVSLVSVSVVCWQVASSLRGADHLSGVLQCGVVCVCVCVCVCV